jgi:hypothetical protein
MIRAFTGPSKLGVSQVLWIAGKLEEYMGAKTWRSGCAFGVDTAVAFIGQDNGIQIELFKPAAPHNSEMVELLSSRDNVVVKECRQGRDDPQSYRFRNEEMVQGADQLVAFVLRATFYRSGEWMTINAAHRMEVRVAMEVIPKEG